MIMISEKEMAARKHRAFVIRGLVKYYGMTVKQANAASYSIVVTS